MQLLTRFVLNLPEEAPSPHQLQNGDWLTSHTPLESLSQVLFPAGVGPGLHRAVGKRRGYAKLHGVPARVSGALMSGDLVGLGLGARGCLPQIPQDFMGLSPPQ